MVVRPRYLFDFLAWQVRRTPGRTAKLRRMAAMAMGARPGAEGVAAARLQHLTARPGGSWMQYSSDGSRMLVVDLARKEAVRLQVRIDADVIERELSIRARAGTAAPEVLYHDTGAGMVVERWLDLRPASERPETLADAMRVLTSTAYAPSRVRVSDYLRGFASVVRVAPALALLQSWDVDEVMVSEVHGDLWPGNIAIDRNGKLILLDWEYARRCVQTHDLWTYLMQERRQRKRPFDDAFLQDFAQQHHVFFGGPMNERLARAHHLLHLIERYAFFAQLNLPHKADEMRFLREQIAAIDPELPE